MASGTRSAPLRAALLPHPATGDTPVRAITVHLQRTEDALSIVYCVTATLARLRVPAAGEVRPGHELWRHTCFELFVAGRLPAYREFNFSPSGEWAACAFSGYRQATPFFDGVLTGIPTPEITVETLADEKLELRARVPGQALASTDDGGALRIGVSAVIEDQAERLTYWALRHPRAEPDFHHPDSFVLELDEVRH